MAKELPAHSPDLLAALAKLTGGSIDDVARVVIDIKAGELPMVYVSRFGDTSLLEVVQAMCDVEINQKEG